LFPADGNFTLHSFVKTGTPGIYHIGAGNARVVCAECAHQFGAGHTSFTEKKITAIPACMVNDF
jgi:hypothetical protein